jgi:glycosyltransferase involved in cell wall biosynthesis
MANPVVSVVIPTYNHAQFLKAAVQSILDQTFTGWEAIVVNNYSQDNTEEIIAAFGDSRIRLVNFHNHGIIAASRNQGIKLANGKFVAFLDSDDTWYPEKLAQCVKMLETGCDAVCHGEFWVKEGSPPREVHYGPERRTGYLSLLNDGNCLSTSAIVVRKSSLESAGGFDEDPRMVTAEDYELWLKLAKIGCRFGIVKEILGEYRLHPGNASKAVLRNFQAELEVLQKHFTGLGDHGLVSRIRKQRRIALAYYAAARGMQAEGNHAEAMKLLLQSWLKYPFILKQYAAAVIGLSGCLRPRRPSAS